MNIEQIIIDLMESGCPQEVLATFLRRQDARKEESALAKKEYERNRKAEYRARKSTDETNQRGSNVPDVHDVPDVTRDKRDNKSNISRGDIYTTRAPALIPVGLSNDNPPIVNPLLVPQPETTASRKASRAKPRTRISENQIPTDADARHATERGLSKSEFLTEWRRFVDWHRAKGSTMADWQAAWRTWLGNRDRFAQPRAGPAREETSGVAKLLAEAYGFDRRNGNETAGNPSDFLALSVTHERVGNADYGDDGGVFGGLRRPDG